MATCKDVFYKASLQQLRVRTRLDGKRTVYEFYTATGRSCGQQTGARASLRWLKERRAMLANDSSRAPVDWDRSELAS